MCSIRLQNEQMYFLNRAFLVTKDININLKNKI